MENEKNQEQKITMVQRPWAAAGVIVVVVLLIILAFGVGQASRMQRAGFAKVGGPGGPEMMQSRSFGAPPMGGKGGQFGGPGMHRRGNRIIGSLTNINGNTLTLKVSGKDQTVVVSSTTSFYKQGDIAKQSDLQVNDVLMVAGTPDSNGAIQATVVFIQ